VTPYSFELAAVAALVLGSIALRATARNRHVRRRQRLTLLLAFAWLAVEAALALGTYTPETAAMARSLARVALALSIINFVVVAGVNPLREDRAPERFPVILQDTVIVVLFAVAATFILRERVLALSAVGAVVIGFALQDTLGNAFAGLAIQTEKPFHVGQWIRVSDFEGEVTEITWRATKLRTKQNTFLIVPNNIMSREAVLNYSEPIIPTRITLDVGVAYETPPNVVKAALLDAVRRSPMVNIDPPPDVLVVDFAASAITYRVRFWIDDYEFDEETKDQVRSAIWYVFRRQGIEIPWPIQIEYSREEAPARLPDTTARLARTLGEVEVFASLSEPDRHELADGAVERLYARGEHVVRQDDPGNSMFVVCDGEMEVVIEPGARRVATIGRPGFFGEMSLLAGAPRSATVRALTDATLMEISTDAFRRFVLEKPDVLERISASALRRRDELARTREDAAAATAPRESHDSFLARVRRFLRIV
jgi:small-conductance mechanosensitive channel/CRP-like cAMP-binding protein